MKIQIDKKITDIQSEFSKKFPGLKLEFYKKEHAANEGSLIKNQLNPGTALSEIMKEEDAGEYKISPEMTVAELEAGFEERYGLHVQVFRRSASLWLQTTTTDSWTLEVQNRKGIHSLQAVYRHHSARKAHVMQMREAAEHPGF